MKRKIILVLHPTRNEAHLLANEIVRSLADNGFEILTSTNVDLPKVAKFSESELLNERNDVELVLVLGGDGTILRGAEIAHGTEIPVLGINLGHVGFLAQIEKPSIANLVSAITGKNYVNEKRMTLAYKVERDEKVIADGWALNEVAVERNTEAMIELFVQVDHRPLSRWGCDGVICATPTGSTAYAFSAGGPVLWPEVDALVLLPISAHALFSRPMVVSPKSEILVTIESAEGLLSADALRKLPLREGDQVLITRDSRTIKLSHVSKTLFTDRLVAKFKLPVEGWRSE